MCQCCAAPKSDILYTENMTVIVGESRHSCVILVEGTRISGYSMPDFFPVMSYFGKQLYHLLLVVLYSFN